jgi:radical SAM protein with 4Fe4S-binding SPASM domain
MLGEPILQILWNGDVVPCCYDFDGRMVLGNLRQQSIAEIWNGAAYGKLRRADEALDFSAYPICQVCDKRF